MMIQRFQVSGQSIDRVGNRSLVADSRNLITFGFAFSEDWAGLAKTAIITTGGSTYHCLLEADGTIGAANMPVLQAGLCSISVFGGELHTADVCVLQVMPSGLKPGGIPPAPPTDIYNQLLARVDGANTSANAAKLDAAKAKSDAAEALLVANDNQSAAIGMKLDALNGEVV